MFSNLNYFDNNINLPLKRINSNWQKEFDDLMKDEFLIKKYNRTIRIKDHTEYLSSFFPQIFYKSNSAKKYFVVDVGPGPGELLEIVRNLGYNIAGFDAKINDCEMGEPYVKLSKMLSDRQQLNIKYCGFENIIDTFPFENNSVFLINFRGSIEQVFKKHLIGEPHIKHHDAKRLEWSFSDNMINDFNKLFKSVERTLVKNGCLLIHGNGTKNISEYNLFILRLCEKFKNLVCDGTDTKTLHRIKKI